MNDTLQTLYRLKRRYGKERARLSRFAYDEPGKQYSQSFRDRCHYETTQWSLAIGMLDQEIEKERARRASPCSPE